MPFQVVEHPLIQHKLGLLRGAETTTGKFRALTREITNLLTYEATRDLPLDPVQVAGWAGTVDCRKLTGKKVAVVPILRAGVGMMQGVLDLIPSARVNFVGLFRDETTLRPVEYYRKFNPDIQVRTAIVVDPMLATGNSLAACCRLLNNEGCDRIKAVCLVAAPEGVEIMDTEFPDVQIYAAALDERLNENGYIIPGLGDAGDRLFGTK
ncbi:uracil phosphoribosyltransferase [bacterium]|nr:uracil phosphoribosyltransferase [candidate division CSSED10-310 bacterium]